MPQAKFLQKSIIELNIGTYLGVEVSYGIKKLNPPKLLSRKTGAILASAPSHGQRNKIHIFCPTLLSDAFTRQINCTTMAMASLKLKYPTES